MPFAIRYKPSGYLMSTIPHRSKMFGVTAVKFIHLDQDNLPYIDWIYNMEQAFAVARHHRFGSDYSVAFVILSENSPYDYN